VVFQHADGAAAVTIVENDVVIAGSDNSVQFHYQDASTPRLTSINVTSAAPQGILYLPTPLDVFLFVILANYLC